MGCQHLVRFGDTDFHVSFKMHFGMGNVITVQLEPEITNVGSQNLLRSRI